MKKKTLLLLFLLATFTFCGCGNEVDTTEDFDNVEDDQSEEELETGIDSAQATSSEEDNESTEEDIVIEIVENSEHSEEYNLRFEMADRCGSSYIMSGDAEVSEFDSWQEGYKTLIDDVVSNNEDAGFCLINVDDDDVPELVYLIDETNLAVATFADSSINYLIKTCCELIVFMRKRQWRRGLMNMLLP